MIAAAAHPYQECSELLCTTSIDNVRISFTILATASGQPAAYWSQSATACEREIRVIGTMCTAAPAASNVGSQRRLCRHHDVALELGRWQAAQHSRQSLIRAAALRDGLDRE